MTIKRILILILVCVSIGTQAQMSAARKLLLTGNSAGTYPYHVGDLTLAEADCTTGTSLTFDYPPNIEAGDLILYVAYSKSGTTVPYPSGFSSIAISNATNMNTRVAYKLATGSESGEITVAGFTAGVNAGFLSLYRNVDNSDIMEGTYSANANTSSSTITGTVKESTLNLVRALCISFMTGSGHDVRYLSNGGIIMDEDSYFTCSSDTGVTFSIQSLDLDVNASDITVTKTILESVNFRTINLVLKGNDSY